ncbi:MAG: SPFH domain-containing protein [Ruminococcus sp.]|nr:SPFH domain-containing protein [Ruminococcus sp.]
MGILKAALTAVTSTMADQWLEFYSCETMPAEALVIRAKKQTGKRSSNTKGSENVISDGSKIIVHEGQAMIMVEQGMITEIATEAGIYTYNSSESPSIFSSSLGRGIIDTFKEMWERMKFGGDAAKDQRIYFFNMKEILNNTFGTMNPVPFRMKYEDLGRPFTVNVKCNGTYTFKISDPVLFYTNVCGNVSNTYDRKTLDMQIRSEFLDALNPAFAEIAAKGIRYDQLAGGNAQVKEAIKNSLVSNWEHNRGILLTGVYINSSTIPDSDLKKIQEYEDKAWLRDPSNAATLLAEAQAEAMKTAAGNSGGAAMGFFGMNLASQAGGMSAQNLYAMGAAQQAAAQQQAANNANTWKCQCGTENTGKFCNNCGSAKPAPAGGWKCKCGAENTGKFCADCGTPKPSEDGWSCSCGAVNKGKFCAECGKPKPAGAPLYRCDKCGWEPADPFNPPKFCAECGDPFDDSDMVK